MLTRLDEPKTRHLMRLTVHFAGPVLGLLYQLGAFGMLLLGVHVTWLPLTIQGARLLSSASRLHSAWKEWENLKNSKGGIA
ncbi:hypothetical protein ACF07Y_42755 [Streptomyces sp. NPDC016566]|uniref:hypothetical protein n=1 Tax=Streptomyces sp. NPDC016566 TaxID=3364967 RepID=UPI0037011CF7